MRAGSAIAGALLLAGCSGGPLLPVGSDAGCVAGAGPWVAFDSNRGDAGRQIYSVKPDGTDLQPITSGAFADVEPAVSPDGKWLAFSSNRSGAVPQVFLKELPAGTETALTSEAAGADEPAWSRDGAWIAYRSGDSIYVIDPQGQRQRVPFDGPDAGAHYGHPAFTSDGTLLIADRVNEIEIAGLDGSNQHDIVTDNSKTEEMPAVSVDGYHLAFAVECSAGVESIWTTPVGGIPGDPCIEGRLLSPADGGTARHPAWGAGDELVYETGQAQGTLLLLHVSDGGVLPLAAGTWDDRNPTWVPACAPLP